MPDIPTLCNLTHSIPTFHQLYTASRQRILTRVTLNQLINNETPFFSSSPPVLFEVRAIKTHPLFGPQTAADMRNYRRQQFKKLETAFRALHEQLIRPQTARAPVLLSIEHCRTLRRVEGLVPWTIDQQKLEGIPNYAQEAPNHRSKYWSSHWTSYADALYEPMYIGPELGSDIRDGMRAEFYVRQRRLRAAMRARRRNGIQA